MAEKLILINHLSNQPHVIKQDNQLRFFTSFEELGQYIHSNNLEKGDYLFLFFNKENQDIAQISALYVGEVMQLYPAQHYIDDSYVLIKNLHTNAEVVSLNDQVWYLSEDNLVAYVHENQLEPGTYHFSIAAEAFQDLEAFMALRKELTSKPTNF